MITTLDNRSNSEIVFELNRLRGKRVTLYCWGSLNNIEGVVSSASVVGKIVSVQTGEDEFVRVPLSSVVGVKEL